jgi:thymidylate synthase ThyX
MQGGAELSEYEIEGMQETWQRAREEAVDAAEHLSEHGLHKSVTNRLLEPFMWHTVVVTSTSWQNFFGLRCNPMAQPEIKAAAELMQQAYESSTPQLKESEYDWHLPYMDWESADEAQYDPQVLVKISAARCARVSYLTHDSVRDVSKDIELYNRLVSADPMPASPLEHVARPEPNNADRPLIKDSFTPGVSTYYAPLLPRYGNFIGWHQHRFDVEARKQYVAYS